MSVRGDNSLFFATGLDNSGLKQGSFESTNIIQGLAGKISKINPFAALAVGAIAAFTIIANGALKMSKSFESAMAEVKTIANVSEKDFQRIKQEVFEIYKQLGTEPPDKLANGLYEIIGAGFEAGDALKILEISSKSATAGVTETAVAADGLTTILNAFKLTANDSQEVADIMFATVDRGKISFEELSTQIATVAPLAASSNISFQEIGAAIATLTKQGVPASVAMTQIRSAIISTNAVLGDGAFKTLTLQEGLQKMYETAGGSQNKLKELAGRIEAVNGIISLAGPNFKGASEDLDAMANSAGSVDRSFKTITSTNANQWDIFRNRIKASTKGIGDAILGMSSNIVGSLNRALDSLQDVTGEAVKQAAKFDILKQTLFDTRTEYDEKIRILRELKEDYPAYLENLDLDKIKNDNLEDTLQTVKIALDDINKLHERRLELSGYLDSADSAQQKKEVYKKLYEANLSEFFIAAKKAKEFAKKNNIELDFSLSESPEKIYGKIRKSLITEDNDGLLSTLFGDSNEIVRELNQINESVGIFKDKLREATNESQKENEALREQRRLLYDNENGFKDVSKQISKINSLEGLDKFKDFKFPKIVDSLNDRKKVITDLNEINNITLKQYTDNKKILKTFLDSENKEISDAALKRKKFFEFTPAPTPEKDDRTALEIFSDGLKDKQDQFKAYNLALKNDDLELAEKLKETYRLKEEDYIEYLQNLYNITQTDGKKALVLEALDKQGSGINSRDKAVAIEPVTVGVVLDPKIDTKSVNAIKRRLTKLNAEFDKVQSESERKKIAEKIKAEEDKLDAAESSLKEQVSLYEDANTKVSNLTNTELREYKTFWKNKLATTKKGTDAYTLIQNKISDANRKINENLLKDAGGLFSEVANLFNRTGDKAMAGYVDQIGNLANAFSNVYSTFNDENASTLQKASGLVSLISQAGALVQEIGEQEYFKELTALNKKNELAAEQLTYERKINEVRRERSEIERNSSAFLDSYYKDDFKAAFDQETESAERLGKALDELSENGILSAEGTGKRLLFGSKTERRSFSIEEILGGKFIQDFFSSDPLKDGLDGINPFGSNPEARARFFDPLSIFGGYSDLKVEKDALKNIQNAFEETLTSMGKVSGDMASFSTEEWLDFFTLLEAGGHITDEGTKKLLEEAKIAMQEYQEALEEMKNIISEFSGELGNNLSDALVDAFNNGTDAAENFAKSVNDVMTNLFLNELISSQFRPFFDDLQKEMKESFGADGDQSWIDDIQRFAAGVGPAMDDAIAAMQLFNDELEAQGYEGFGSDSNRSGLSGAITTITEDTANILAGTLNSIRIDISNGLGIAQQSSLYLSQIVVNTSYNKNLEVMAIRLQNIETLLT